LDATPIRFLGRPAGGDSRIATPFFIGNVAIGNAAIGNVATEVSGPTAAVLPSIPQVRSTTLSGEPVVLPDQLHGRVLVVILGFDRKASAQAAAWGRRLAAAHGSDPSLAYYEAPMLGSVPGLLRGFVLRSIRNSVPQRAWPHFLPITEHEDQWRALVHPNDGSIAYLVLCDSDGRVHWQTRGQADDGAFAALQQQIGLLDTK
jgi:hypothetical protein